MSITRVNPSAWAFGQKLTAVQANLLDLNSTYALDKRSGQTDTLSSIVTVASGGSIILATGSELTAASTSLISLITNQSGCNLQFTGTGCSFYLTDPSSSYIFNGTGVFDGSNTFEAGGSLIINGQLTASTIHNQPISIGIATQTTDIAVNDITITSQAPYASASTNKNSSNINLVLGVPVSGGSYGNISFNTTASLQNNLFNITTDGVGTAIINSPLAINITQPINSSSSSTASNITISAASVSGSSSMAGDVQINGGTASGASSFGGEVFSSGGNATGVGATAGDSNVFGGTTTGSTCASAGSVNIKGGQALSATVSGAAGSVNITGGKAVSNNLNGGNVNILGGSPNGTGNAGNVIISGAAGVSATPGYVQITAGNATSSGNFGADVYIQSGAYTATNGNGGIIHLQPGLGNGTGHRGYTQIEGNVALGSGTPAFGGGLNVIWIGGQTSDPSAPATGCILYYDSSSSTLKAIDVNNSIQVLATF